MELSFGLYTSRLRNPSLNKNGTPGARGDPGPPGPHGSRGKRTIHSIIRQNLLFLCLCLFPIDKYLSSGL